MLGCEMHLETWVSPQPRTHHLAMMDTEVVADQVNFRDRHRSSSVDFFQQLDKFSLTLATTKDSNHLARARIQSSKQIQCPVAPILMLDMDRNRAWPCRGRAMLARAWLDRCFLIDTKDPFIRFQGACIQIAQLHNLGSKPLIQRRLAVEPVVGAPGFESMRPQNPLDRLGRNVLDNAALFERPSQFGASP